MTDQPNTEHRTPSSGTVDLRHVADWLSGTVEIRVSRKVLLIGGVVLLILAGIALD
jgi:hypothetical protein